MKINNTSYKFILHKNRKNDRDGYIYLQKIQNRKKTRKSLGLPKLNEKNWNSKTERVRKNKSIDYLMYNSKIEDVLNDISKNPKYGFETNNKSFLKYFENYVYSDQLLVKHGTRIKYITIFNKLVKFVEEKENNDLLFSELNLDFLNDLKTFLLKDLETNTAIHYLKVIQSIIKKSIKSGSKINNPFIEFTFPKKEKKEKQFLSDPEIMVLINKRINNKRLDRVRNMFLFQFFSQGMRVSDLLTLRYSNLLNGRLRYQMFKTKNEIDIRITPLHIELLSGFVDFGFDKGNLILDQNNFLPENEVERIKNRINEITINKKESLLLEELKKNEIQNPVPPPIKPQKKFPLKKGILQYNKNHIPYLFYSLDSIYLSYRFINKYDLFIRKLNIIELSDELKLLKNYKSNKGKFLFKKISKFSKIEEDYTSIYNKIKKRLDHSILILKRSIKELQDKHFKLSLEKLDKLGTGAQRNDFVFNFLKNEEFKYVTDFSKINKDQYIRINKSSIVYNRNLKELQKLLGIQTTLRSHLPRVSYTNLMWNIDGVDTQDIKDSLGHSSIQVTDAYLRTGFRKDKKDEIQEKFIDRYNKK